MHHAFIVACDYTNYFVLVHWANFTLHATRIFWRVSKGKESGKSNAKIYVYGKKNKKRKIKEDRKRLNCRVSPGMAWDEWIPAEHKDKRGSVARETKEILKDCHGNRCFGNRVLKAYRESALENGRTRGEGVTVRVENEAEGATRERKKMDQRRRLSHSDAISDRVTRIEVMGRIFSAGREN